MLRLCGKEPVERSSPQSRWGGSGFSEIEMGTASIDRG
jgi:hypothetical protein